MTQTQKLPRKFTARFRKKMKLPPKPSFLEDREIWAAWTKQRQTMQKEVMADLIKLYDLEKSTPAVQGYRLAWKLAEEFVPAMQVTEKRGAKGKWTTEKLIALVILVSRTQAKHPQKRLLKEIFGILHQEAEGSALEGLLATKTKNIVLQDRYSQFLKSPEFQLIKKLKGSVSTSAELEEWENFMLYEIGKNNPE